jgi:hypothetical protein
MFHLCADADLYLQQGPYMRAVLHKLHPFVHEAKHAGGLRKIASAVMRALYERHEVVFLAQVRCAPENDLGNNSHPSHFSPFGRMISVSPEAKHQIWIE